MAGYERAAYDAERSGAVIVRDLPPGALGLHSGINGEIEISREVAALAREFAKRASEDAAQLRANLDLAAAGGAGADAAEVRADVERAQAMSTLSHETLHGFGPTTSNAYAGEGLMVEEVTNEVATRSWMSSRFGVDPSLAAGSYDGWIGGVESAIEDVFGVDEGTAERILQRAADRYKHRPSGSVKNEEAALTAFAQDVASSAGRATTAQRSKLMTALRAVARSQP